MINPEAISVLVVDDSQVTREFLTHVFSEAGIKVIRALPDGQEAVEFVKRQRPDVITMDIYMPGMNGLEATRQIMGTNPVPIVIVSGNWDPGEVDMTFSAMKAGALAVVRRPYGIGHPEHAASVRELVKTVRLMSEVKVVRRWSRSGPEFSWKPALPPVPERARTHIGREIKLVAVGASAGGPPVLQRILSGLNADLPFPLLIVQHMAPGFLPGMLNWLGETSRLRLSMAQDGGAILPGNAYFAPDGLHMGVSGDDAVFLSSGEPEHGARPSISYLFRSVARAFDGNAAAVLLTGMGNDGAAEMKSLKERGAVTIAQDKESSAVYGMPEAAAQLDAATMVLSPEQITAAINRFAKKWPPGENR